MPLALGDLLYAADYVAYADSRQLISIADLLLKTLVAGVYNYKVHSFPQQNLTNSAVNLVNSAANRGKADEIPLLTTVTQLSFRGLIKS